MGYVIEYQTKTGKIRFTAMYRDLKGVPRSAGTYSSDKLASKAWNKAENSLAAGLIGDPRRGRQSLTKYVTIEWLPNHILERTSLQTYTYLLERYILPDLGAMKIGQIMPGDVRTWVADLQKRGVQPPTIQKCKIILDSILTTAFNDQVTSLHAGKGVKTPPVAKKPRRIITAAQFEAIFRQLPDETLKLLVETDIESGLRWGELTELRVKDLDFETGLLTVSRVVVKLNSKFHPEGKRFLVKHYPKDKEWRALKLPRHLVTKLAAFTKEHSLGKEDLFFEYHPPTEAARRTLPEDLPDPETLGWTEPNDKGRAYRHGTTTAYAAGKCRCQHCRNAIAAYRAQRRTEGKDEPRTRRILDSDGHIPGDWFRPAVWNPAVERAAVGFHVTPHGLRHAHASWLLAGGADVQVVKERLGHGSLSTTSRYLGTLPGADDAALAALDNIRGKRDTETTAVSNAYAPKAQSTADSAKDARILELEAKLAQFKALLDA